LLCLSCSLAELREEVEEYMKDFDEGEQLEKIQREKRTREPDEDGFVVVKQRYAVGVIILSVMTSSHASNTHTNLVFLSMSA
jgi:Ribosomal RNA-processing protein 7 (RRP7) C-terminal domain